MVDLKSQMEPLCGIPVDRQRLIFRGELLVDSNKLKDAREPSILSKAIGAYSRHS